MSPMWISILILLMVFVAFISGKVQMSMIGTLVMLACLVFNILPANRVFAGFSNSSVILLAAMFVVGQAIQKTTLVTSAANLIQRYKDKPQIFIMITCLISFLIAMVTTAEVAVVLLLPLLTAVCDEIGLSRSKVLYPMATVAYAGAGSWFLGVGAMNMSWSSMMMGLGAKTPLNINDFLFIRLPFLIVMILYMAFVAPKLLPNNQMKAADAKTNSHVTAAQLSNGKNKWAIFVISVTVLLMIAATYLHISSYIFALTGAVVLVLTGVLSNKEALASINLNIMLFICGMLTLADALNYTGAGKAIGKLMSQAMSGIHNTYILACVFYLVVLIVAQLVGSLGAVTIFIPLVTLTCLQLGLDPRGAVLITTVASGSAILAPTGNSLLAMIMEPGGYRLTDYVKCGLPLVLLWFLMSGLVVELMYPLG